MTASLALGLIGIGILWVSAIAATRTRTWQFLAFLAISSVVIAGATMSGGRVGEVIRLGVFAFALAASLWPTPLGLGSFTRSDMNADKAFRELERALDDPGGAQRALDLIATLEVWTDAAPRDSWAIAARLYRRHVLLAGLGAIDRPNEPTVAFRNAGHDYWVTASWQRVIGGRRSPAVWDEDVVLRCFAGDFENLIPREALRGDPTDPAAVRTIEAERLVDDLRVCRLVHPVAIEVRDLLVTALAADLELAKGDRSPEAIDRQRVATTALNRKWPQLTADSQDPRA